MMDGFMVGIIYWGLGGLLLAYLVFNLHKKMAVRVKKASMDLESRGYVIDQAYMRPNGTLTRIWSRYNQPIGLYVQASNLDPIAIAAGNMGIADIKLGNGLFDSSFVVRSNEPKLVAMVFDAQLQHTLLTHKNIRFRTGSLNNLLGVDYFPEMKSGRDLRSFWMLEKAGTFTEAESQELLELGKQIAQKAEKYSQGLKNLESSAFEGR